MMNSRSHVLRGEWSFITQLDGYFFDKSDES